MKKRIKFSKYIFIVGIVIFVITIILNQIMIVLNKGEKDRLACQIFLEQVATQDQFTNYKFIEKIAECKILLKR